MVDAKMFDKKIIEQLSSVSKGYMESIILELNGKSMLFKKNTNNDMLHLDKNKYDFYNVTNNNVEKLSNMGEQPDIIGINVMIMKPDYSYNLKNLCKMQDSFRDLIYMKYMKMANELSKNPKFKEIFEDHYFKDQKSHLGAYQYYNSDGYKYLNGNTIARYDKNNLWNDTTIYGDKHEDIYFLQSSILDMPRFNEKITLYRHGGINSFSKNFQVGKVYPADIMLSTGFYNWSNSGKLLKINIPANFPLLISSSDCGDTLGKSEIGGFVYGEGSQVLLPYTTDPRGMKLTFGWKFIGVNEVYMILPNDNKKGIMYIQEFEVEFYKNPIPIDFDKVYGKDMNSKLYKPELNDKIGGKIQEMQQLLIKGVIPPLVGYSSYEINDINKAGYTSGTSFMNLQSVDDIRSIKESTREKMRKDYDYIRLVVGPIWDLYENYGTVGLDEKIVEVNELMRRGIIPPLPEMSLDDIYKLYDAGYDRADDLRYLEVNKLEGVVSTTGYKIFNKNKNLYKGRVADIWKEYEITNGPIKLSPKR